VRAVFDLEIPANFISEVSSFYLVSFRYMLGEAWAAIKQHKHSPREMWHVYFIKILDGFSYFSLNYFLVLYLSENFGMSDVESAWCFGLYGMLIIIYGVSFGFLIDMFGVRMSLIFGTAALTAGRFVLAGTQ
jgi:dipeptide/tripeptide permease